MVQKTRLSSDIVKKIKQVEIYTKRLLRGTLIGDSRSAIKGTGFEFDQIREYQEGDDIRFIDWHASARLNKILVKEYREERSRNILLAVDVSGSAFWGSQAGMRHDLMAQAASVLALVADHGNDHVGLLLFADTVYEYIPPRRGRAHVHRIMEQLFGYPPHTKRTCVSTVLQRLVELKKKDALVFLLSDFIDTDFERYMSLAVKQYDMVAIRCLQQAEQQFPSVGLLTVQDNETGVAGMIPATYAGIGQVNAWLKERITLQDILFKRYGVEVLDVTSDRTVIADIVRFFARRMHY